MELAPKISVLMSVRNGLPYVKQTVPSILGQTHPDFEFVIVDNCSTDGTRDYLQEISRTDQRIKVFLNERDLGHSGGLNRGLEACRGDWIARIDADDVALPRRLERQLAFVEAHPEVAVASCLAYYINEKGERRGKTFHDLTTAERFREYLATNEAIGLTHPCVFMRRDVVCAIGGYREPFGGANDIDLWNRISEGGHMILVQPERLMEYRIHSAAISSGKFLDSRLKYEWVRACMVARRSGRAEPDWETFLQGWRSVGIFKRLNRHRKTLAKMYYRLGGENFITGKKLKGGTFFIFSAALQPRYAFGRLTGQLMRQTARNEKTISKSAETGLVKRGEPSPVAVIIACHNASAYLRETLDSCLNQTRPPEQIIVVDDASTDGSNAVLDEYANAGKIRLVRNPANLGRGRSFGRALEHLTAKYVAILDADDLALPKRFEQQVKFLEANPKVGCCGSFVQYCNQRGEIIAHGVLDLLSEKDFQRYLQSDEPFGLYCPAVMLRAEIFQNPALRFRPEFWPADDIDLWNRIGEAGWQVLALPEFLTLYRIHSGSTVTNQARSTRRQYEWVRACLRARREGCPEPTHEEFFSTFDNVPWYTRLNRWRKAESKVAYRAAGFAFGERRHWRTAGYIVKAFCLQPLRVFYRVCEQVFFEP